MLVVSVSRSCVMTITLLCVCVARVLVATVLLAIFGLAPLVKHDSGFCFFSIFVCCW